MPEKIKRDISLIKYRNLPLQEYYEKIDEEIIYYPKASFFYWIKLESLTTKKLTKEFIKLVNGLDLKNIIVMSGINKPWLSKRTRERKDSKQLTKALAYFKSIKIGKKFNGALEVKSDELIYFIQNFYTVTVYDGGFLDYHLIDENENLLFHIHYSGEIKILVINRKINPKLLGAIKETTFIDSYFKGTDRI